jgi:hypothetical protein
MGENKSAVKFSVGESEVIRILQKGRRRWEDSIKINRKGTGKMS